MPKTVFVPNSPVTAAFLNAINNPSFTANPANDGELPLIRDLDLDSSAGSLLARSNEFLNAFNTTTAAGLIVTISAGTVVLADGTPVAKPSTQLEVPANAVRFIWANPTGVLTQGAVKPSDGSVMLSRVTTDATKVTAIADLRPRFQIGTVDYRPPAVVGQKVFFEFPVNGFEYVDLGWIWLNPVGGVKISKAGAGGDVARDGYEQLFKKMWLAPGTTVFNTTNVPVAKGQNADADWVAGRRLGIADPAFRSTVSAGSFAGTNYRVGDFGGEKDVQLTLEQTPVHSHIADDPDVHYHGIQVLRPTNSGPLKTGIIAETKQGDFLDYLTGPANVTLDVSSVGNNLPHNNIPPYFVSQPCIFTGILA